jgi:flavin-dependent dehydrogenase
MSVAVFEPRAAPIEKACGEGLMPGAVAELARLGVTVGGHQFRGIRYLDVWGHAATADFAAGRAGRGVQRSALHTALHRAAVEAGVSVIPRRVTDVTQTGSDVGVAGERAAWLVAADGLHSPIRRSLGLERPGRHRRWGLRAHFACPPWTDRVEVYWSPAGEAYVTPVADDCVGVAILSGSRGAFDARLTAFPALRARLPGSPVDRVLAAGPLRQDVRARVAGRVLLVGDAAGYVDALTGEGLAIAFGCAAALVARLAAGRPAAYEQDYRAITRRYRLLTQALVAATRPPWARRAIVPAASAAPWLFRAAVRQLAGSASLG